MNNIKLTATRLSVLVFLLCGLMTLQVQAAAGDLDPSFGNGGIVLSPYYSMASSRASMVAIQSDGKIVVTAPGFTLVRYNTDGSPDLSFGSGGKAESPFSDRPVFASAIAIRSDGKIVAAGGGYGYDEENPNYDFLLARYNTDGSLDSTFGSDGKVISTFGTPNYGANDIAIQPDGKIVAVGLGETYSGSDFLLARFNTNGSLDSSFGLGGKIINTFNGNTYFCNAVVIQRDGKIVAAGGSNGAFALARYNTDGSLDTSFGTSGKVLTNFNNSTAAYDLAIQSDGKIVAVGTSTTTFLYFALAKYNTDGSLDATFGTSGKVVINFASHASARGVAIQSDGKIVAVGTSSSQGFTVVRCNIDGSLDPTFGSNGIVVTPIGNPSDYANAAAIQSDGKIVTAGIAFDNNGGRPVLIRYQARAESSFTVTRSDDRNNPTCAVGDCSLREAVNAANASPSDDTINFASGLTSITLTNEIVINNAGALTINGTGANNLTIDGGAGPNRIFFINEATVTVSGVTLTGGNGTGANFSGEGGAIFAYFGLLTLDGVHIAGNSAYHGGGVFFNVGTAHITNSTISGNTASYSGGGIYINFSGSLTIANSTISGNTSNDEGGGIYADEYTFTTLRNVTITNNTAYYGGGIKATTDYPWNPVLDFGNTIVAGNTATSGIAPEIYNNRGISIFTSAGGNLVGDSPGDSTNTETPIAYQPTDIRDTNPLLGALQNNGGSTPTRALLPGSPAIDKGINSLAVDPFNNSILQTDQRGLTRIVGSAVDIGAFEFAPAKSRKRIRFF